MSKLLDRKNNEHEVKTYVNETGAVIILHEWIEALKEQMIYNGEISEKWATRNEDGRVYADLSDINDPKLVYVCYIQDTSTGVTYTGLGEFNKLNSPSSNIGKSNPASICRNRAIDNAMLQFLGLKKDITNGSYIKLYSSAEIPVTGKSDVINLDSGEVVGMDIPTKTGINTGQEQNACIDTIEGLTGNTDNTLFTEMNTGKEKETEAATDTKASGDNLLDATSDKAAALGLTIMTSGRNKGKTFDEILKTDISWWSWAKKTADSGEVYKLPKAVKNEVLEYLNLHPEIPLK